MLACLPGWEGGGSSSRAPLHACTPESEVLPRNPRERKEGRKEGQSSSFMGEKEPKDKRERGEKCSFIMQEENDGVDEEAEGRKMYRMDGMDRHGVLL